MYSKYSKLRDERGANDNAVAAATGIPPTTIYDWKQRSEKNPDAGISIGNIKKIADYFGVTIEYFLDEGKA